MIKIPSRTAVSRSAPAKSFSWWWRYRRSGGCGGGGPAAAERKVERKAERETRERRHGPAEQFLEEKPRKRTKRVYQRWYSLSMKSYSELECCKVRTVLPTLVQTLVPTWTTLVPTLVHRVGTDSTLLPQTAGRLCCPPSLFVHSCKLTKLLTCCFDPGA